MLHSRSSAFLLSIAVFMVLLLSCITSSLVHAKYELTEFFKGLSCSGTSVLKMYKFDFNCHSMKNLCLKKPNFFSSTKKTCIHFVPHSPKAGEFMELQYSDKECLVTPLSVTIHKLDTCIPSDHGSSFMIKGCTSRVTYSDRKCQNEVRTASLTLMDCFNGNSVRCNHTVPVHLTSPIRFSSGNSTHMSGGVKEFMLRSCVGIVVSVMTVLMMMM
ncbi:hypothetical protein FDP41_003795 [Naegleria fowleri]|uniref:SUEL-type lectin domain-containing protein n=1 Tax=Naegleria fowleri TaxID=5763 RepID=A0A6A5BQZ9_NAEFO|nr:uncharacterized protein FDP41_003795 [Naegleria fowleri]KAF0977142.1 hypothetical protein FDP41_003795 [Naegleria fowleri]